MLNYSVHAIEELRLVANTTRTDTDTEAVRDILPLLHEAVKFELPENGNLFGEDFSAGYDILDTSLLHLPFPAVALEYRFEFFKGNPLTHFASPKRIALCMDYEAYKDTHFGRVVRKYVPRMEESGGLFMISLFVVPSGKWAPMAWGVVIPRFEPDGTNLSVFRYGKNNSKESKVGFHLFPVLPAVVAALLEMLGPETAVNNGLNDVGEEVNAVIGLLAALSCSNVKLQTEKAPQKLNAKRLKNNKLPFFEYKTVVIETKEGAKGRGAGVTVTGRQSPREHVRRGHIRRYADGKRIWVNSMMVGRSSKGHIEKRYAIK